MPAGIATLVYKDSAGTNRNFLTFSTTGDLTGSFTAMTGLHNGAGALISPATSGLQGVSPVGSGGFATGQVALNGNAPVPIAAARPGLPGTGRISITINNISAVEIWVGLVGVSSTTGFPLLAGESVTLQTAAAIYAVLAAAGTPTIGFIELF